jgi:hypothetical protein
LPSDIAVHFVAHAYSTATAKLAMEIFGQFMVVNLFQEKLGMVRMIKTAAFAAALSLAAAPAFAQAIDINPLGLDLAPIGQLVNPLNLDLDPLHIITPAPAPAPAPMMHHHHHHWHHHWHHHHHHHHKG